MNEITAVLVDGHIFDVKNDMVHDNYFPNSLFPGATFKMIIDNDVANNRKVEWRCGSAVDGHPVAVSEDGTVTFPGVDESCCGKMFFIAAMDKTTEKLVSVYLFTVKRFFKYSEDVYRSVKDILPWVESMNGKFPEARDVDSFDYNDTNATHDIKREVNAGLYQEWGNVVNSGWKINTPYNLSNDCGIYAFNKEKDHYYFLENYGFNQQEYTINSAQAVAFYGKSRV